MFFQSKPFHPELVFFRLDCLNPDLREQGVWVALMQPWLQTDIYQTGDRGAGREVTERAGQLCPPGEFGMCPPWASCRPGVKVNKRGDADRLQQPPLPSPFFFHHSPRNRNQPLYPLATPSCSHPYLHCHMPPFSTFSSSMSVHEAKAPSPQFVTVWHWNAVG